MAIVEIDETVPLDVDLVGPVIRTGVLAEAVIDAVAEDNPGRDVIVMDRDDYVRIHTEHECRLTLSSLEKHYGQAYPLSALEIDMPSFKGRLRTRTTEYIWYLDRRQDLR
jgi:toluene monooxygenase system protein D